MYHTFRPVATKISKTGKKKRSYDSFFPKVTLLKYSRMQLRIRVRAAETADSLILPRFPENWHFFTVTFPFT